MIPVRRPCCTTGRRAILCEHEKPASSISASSSIGRVAHDLLLLCPDIGKCDLGLLQFTISRNGTSTSRGSQRSSEKLPVSREMISDSVTTPTTVSCSMTGSPPIRFREPCCCADRLICRYRHRIPCHDFPNFVSVSSGEQPGRAVSSKPQMIFYSVACPAAHTKIVNGETTTNGLLALCPDITSTP